jgi:hypothetical protein
MKSTPALSKAARIASTVARIGDDFSFSKFLTVTTLWGFLTRDISLSSQRAKGAASATTGCRPKEAWAKKLLWQPIWPNGHAMQVFMSQQHFGVGI